VFDENAPLVMLKLTSTTGGEIRPCREVFRIILVLLSGSHESDSK